MDPMHTVALVLVLYSNTSIISQTPSELAALKDTIKVWSFSFLSFWGGLCQVVSDFYIACILFVQEFPTCTVFMLQRNFPLTIIFLKVHIQSDSGVGNSSPHTLVQTLPPSQLVTVLLSPPISWASSIICCAILMVEVMAEIGILNILQQGFSSVFFFAM